MYEYLLKTDLRTNAEWGANTVCITQIKKLAKIMTLASGFLDNKHVQSLENFGYIVQYSMVFEN